MVARGVSAIVILLFLLMKEDALFPLPLCLCHLPPARNKKRGGRWQREKGKRRMAASYSLEDSTFFFHKM